MNCVCLDWIINSIKLSECCKGCSLQYPGMRTYLQWNAQWINSATWHKARILNTHCLFYKVSYQVLMRLPNKNDIWHGYFQHFPPKGHARLLFAHPTPHIWHLKPVFKRVISRRAHSRAHVLVKTSKQCCSYTYSQATCSTDVRSFKRSVHAKHVHSGLKLDDTVRKCPLGKHIPFTLTISFTFSPCRPSYHLYQYSTIFYYIY